MGLYDGLEEAPAAPVAPAAPPGAPQSMYDGLELAPLQPGTPKVAEGALESIKAGLQGSATGLAWRGKLPDLVMNPEHAKWWERALTGISQVAAELPMMAVGGAAGSVAGTAAGSAIAPGPGSVVGGVLGTGAGMFGVPAAIRESLIQAYKSGEIKTGAEFWNILREVAGTTAKEAAIGAATMGAGSIVARTAGKALLPSIGSSITVPTGIKAIGAADVAAQIATMTTVPAALQGRLPDLQEVMDAAIVIGGLKGAHMATDRILSTYVKTGKTPAEQVADVQEGRVAPTDFVGPTAPPRAEAAYRPQMAAEAVAAAEGKLTDFLTRADAGKPLTDAERAERVYLTNNLKNPESLAKWFGLTEAQRLDPVTERESAQKVHDDVLEQLRAADQARQDTGRAPLGDEHAQAVAALVRARVATRAARLGMLPEDVYNERRLQIRDEAQAEVAQADASIPAGAQRFTPPETDLFGNPVEVTNAPRYGVEGLATQEVPLERLVLSKEVPQFKHAANEEGVITPLGGTFDRTGVGPIQVWERTDGTLEVISGRHRLDLARRTGETTIPSQIHREADGFTARMAATLDAQLNIREEQGNVADYAQYFKDSGLTREAADERGLLARAKGRAGFAIARDGTSDLAAAHRAGVLSDEAALAISAAAPGSERLQALGMVMVQEGKSALIAVNTMKAVELMAGDRLAAGAQGDIFGFDDSAMREASAMAKKATSIQRKISEQISAVSGASRRPQLAAKMGVDVADPEGIQRKIVELRQEQYLWDNWPIHPELVARLRETLKQGPVDEEGQHIPPAEGPPETPAEGAARDREAAEQALRKQTPERPDLLFQSKDPFYSELVRQLEARGSLKASPAQWKSTLANLKGIKPDEIKWSGVEEWLDAQEGPVTRDHVLEFLRANGVRISEVMLRPGGPDANVREFHDISESVWSRMTPTEQADLRSEYLADSVRDEGFDGDTKFSQYTLPGGENYRELLLTLPEKEPSFALDDFIDKMNEKYGVQTDGLMSRPGWEDTDLAADELATLRSLQAQKANEHVDTNRFASSHFDAPNILAHIRFNDRTDADGKRVLFLEEIQSDFGQATKKAKDTIAAAVDKDFNGIIERMQKAGILEVNCD